MVSESLVSGHYYLLGFLLIGDPLTLVAGLLRVKFLDFINFSGNWKGK